MVTAGTEDNMIRQSYKITALYCRIDHGSRSAMSAACAQNQQKRLVHYAKEQGLHNLQIFCDCGYSGCNTDRPEYQKMLAAIRAGQVSNVVVLNLSRLNRSYANQHQLLLELEKHNVVLHSVLEQLSGSIVPVFSTFLKAGCA